ncbi:hypothetical protein CC86DRAFT_327621 [Ophiobolus disseminans]|uniref:MYND-type domain-containing protein n=1 Tax=Ophiobolus disseminans TaxID=1469910 RepID=A0A6A6ZTH2_9PLEO|nr:hypothetical protein CC86DRAFT_327621 [Ophiobolus disseminans]
MSNSSEPSNTTSNPDITTSPEVSNPDTTSSPEVSSSSTAAPAPQPTSTCAHCSKSPESLKQCNKCHSVAYCNKDCQKAHFKTHKKECASLAQEYVKAHEPKMASRSTASTKGGRDRGLQKWQFDT